MQHMPWFIPFLIYFGRICDVSIGTVRTMVLISGYKYTAAALGFFEVVVWVLAVSGALKYIANPFALIAYGAGFASGVLVGMWMEERLALGHRIARVICPGSESQVSTALRESGFRVTRVDGVGRHGPVEIAFLVLPRKRLAALRHCIRSVSPAAFITIERVEHASGGGLGDSSFGRQLMERLLPVRK
jgi:uncharacterized protein YebE (UPF0316 family)